MAAQPAAGAADALRDSPQLADVRGEEREDAVGLAQRGLPEDYRLGLVAPVSGRHWR